MRRIVLVLITALFANSLSSFAQEQKNNQWGFRSINNLALLNGKGVVSGGLQTVNGARMGDWFVGAGAGLDFYRYRSVPLFIDLRREISLNKGKAFAFADAGYNLPWVTDAEDIFNTWGNTFYKVENKFKGGLYTDFGLGYAIYNKSGNAFLLSLGYSVKKFKKTVITTTQTNVNQPQPTTQEDIKRFTYDFNRLTIKVGWQF